MDQGGPGMRPIADAERIVPVDIATSFELLVSMLAGEVFLTAELAYRDMRPRVLTCASFAPANRS